MGDFGYKLSRITSCLQTGKIDECEAREQLRKIVPKEISDGEIVGIAKEYAISIQRGGVIPKNEPVDIGFARAILKVSRGE